MISANPLIDLPFSPYRLSGIVYGALLNHRPALAALGDAVHASPYKAPPAAPILYQKPRNTLAAHGATIVIPAGESLVNIGASLGMVIGRTACRVRAADALGYLAGYIVVGDLCVPHDSFYRPSLRFRARDGFCPLGPMVTPLEQIATPDKLQMRVYVDGELVHESSTQDRFRGVAQLLADVTEFMTLSPGDILLLGASQGAPNVRAGQESRIEIDGLAPLKNTYVAEEDAA